MKRKTLILILLVLLLGLFGCGGEITSIENRVQVSITGLEGCTVENNGLWVEPGGDAVFLLELEYGTTLAGTDYSGAFSTQIKDGKLELTLEDIQYPVRVGLELTHSFCTITYEPNGGEGEQTVKTYDLTYHLRPNADIGTGMFTRDGFVLTGWNTEPDGSGTRVGLGSRATVDGELTLYAQWEPWTDVSEFEYTVTKYGNITINAYLGKADTVIIPAYIDGREVTAIATRAFENNTVRHVILPDTMDRLAPDTFMNCTNLESVMLFDNIQVISDSVFTGCENLQTLYTNAIEAPYGFDFRKESCYADKVDRLILAQGQRKLVVYGGCSAWYNLDGADMYDAFGGEYTVVNMGLNGTVNSVSQMQILSNYLEAGDVLLHTLELTSEYQLLQVTDMGSYDNKLWAGLEYNYDLFSMVDLRTLDGAFDSFCDYLTNKKSETGYTDHYTDSQERLYVDEYGCIPFYRNSTQPNLADKVQLDPDYVNQGDMVLLESYYDRWHDMGVTVYISYACVNMDAVPAEERGNVELMDSLVRDVIGGMDSAVLISKLSDFLYEHENFFDTNYHLRSEEVKENTAVWIRDVKAQMVLDGSWKEDTE